MALGDLLAEHARSQTPASEMMGQWKAFADGMAPDEAKALRRLLTERARPAPEGVDPDLELARLQPLLAHAAFRRGRDPHRTADQGPDGAAVRPGIPSQSLNLVAP